MKPVCCSDRGNPEEKRNYRFHYCGVCKSIGARYGHKMRLFLNHDVAFLAGLMTELSGEGSRDWLWGRAYYRGNCFVLPKEVSRVGEVAAAINVLLAELNLEDKIQDARSKRAWLWKWLKNRTSSPGREAVKRLKTWQFPVERIDELAEEQREREREAGRSLDDYSQTTAIITGIVFRRAGGIVNKDADTKGLYALGFSFGRLVYILDALEDFGKDQRKGEFNAIASAYGYAPGERRLSAYHREAVAVVLTDLSGQVSRRLKGLPVSAEFAAFFSRRLQGNLNRRLAEVREKTCSSGVIPERASVELEPSVIKPRRRFQLSAVGIPRGLNKALNGLLFMMALPFMYGLRFLDFGAAAKPVGTKKKGGCLDACCCDCFCCDCCECGWECSGSDCNCCDCDCGCCDCDC